MKRRAGLILLAALALSACSRSETSDDVPPLPEQPAETGKALMTEAERAAGNAAARAETETPPARSATETVNEETP
ncbi:outer membrane PBP1 activator LpoA protein [Sphingomonas kaistensis]|uniref:Outer membrane PBP1 activator LpoA protein n=1 Tax=Sphingomonas kaistensis TaxID=298708 RepID=A0A7X6BGD9_9SPHN|nr:hypothetical protein [Sphingomonas kaistensis]NJC06354.1 outer membrane PBP1 activator LpoA protein [Sphingomonas kaistensis]